MGLHGSETVYAFDSTTVDWCLALFPWGQFRRRKSAVKLYTLLDVRGSIPTNVYLTGGQGHEVNLLDQLLLEVGAFYLMDRGYVDFARLHTFPQAGAFFITRAKKICRSTCSPRVRSIAPPGYAKAFYGTSANAVKTQGWVALSV